MPWIPIRSVDKHVHSMLIKMDDSHMLTIKSFKKDRIVTVKKLDGSFNIIEEGFRNQNFTVDEKDLKKTMKDIIDLEYPRSHKVMVSEQEFHN
jgi:DNA polymerase III sliding clamp (beta) subunit (PCNA family)